MCRDVGIDAELSLIREQEKKIKNFSVIKNLLSFNSHLS